MPVQFSDFYNSLDPGPAIPAFVLAAAGEVHRCAGKVGSDFTAILDNAQIRSTKRLFATATLRTDFVSGNMPANKRNYANCPTVIELPNGKA